MANEAEARVAAPVHYDQTLQITAFSLMALGMAMIFTSSTFIAQSQYNDAYFFIKRQGIYALLGLGALFLGRSIDYHYYKRWAYPILLLSLVSLLLVFAPGIGGKVRGAARWLHFGPLTLQPSEFAKLALVIFLASSLARKQDKIKDFSI
ncbi:MAG TPA: FtsW/RodA/SpoVE family cell cycle protein, partial [Desulfobaccales bacterium]|nr:FtsW/RodA/SpoVE family cell cycle protein [Desulfobaccales bacterium]